MMEIDREKFITLCEDLDITPDPSYSGRGMYGKQCIGVQVNTPADSVRFLYLVVPKIDPNFKLVDEFGGFGPGELEYSPEWEDIRSDSMGRGMIFYWPDIQAVDVEDAERTLI